MSFIRNICGVLLSIALISLTSCGSDQGKAVHYVKIGTGSQVGVYYAAGLALADFVNESQDDEDTHIEVDVSVDATDGSVYNINALMQGALDFGFAQADRQYQAYHGFSTWENKPQKKLRFICSFHPELVTLVAADDANIEDLYDLEGKVVSIGSYGSGTRGNALDCVRRVNLIADKDFNAENLKASEAAMMLQDGRIDAFFYTAGHPNGLITESSSGKRKVHLVPIKGMDELINDFPYYSKGSIPSSYYPQMSNIGSIPTIGVLTTFLTSEDTNDDVVYEITKAIFENMEDLRKRHPSFAILVEEDMLAGAFAPIHDGAFRYYQEVGLIP